MWTFALRMTGGLISPGGGHCRRGSILGLAVLLVIGLMFSLSPPLVRAEAPAGIGGPPPKSVIQRLRDWQKQLDEAEQILGQSGHSDAALAALREQLLETASRSRLAAEEVEPESNALRADLSALGPPPEEGAPPEAANVAARRKELNERLAAVAGAAKEAELVAGRAERLAGDVKSLRRTLLTERILRRSVSPVSASVWRKVIPELRDAIVAGYRSSLAQLAGLAGPDASKRFDWPVAAGLGLTLLLAFPFRAWLIRRFGYVTLDGPPSYWQRLRTAAFTATTRALFPAASTVAVYFLLLSLDVFTEPMISVAQVATAALVVLFFVGGFCRAALAPDEPEWRLVPIRNLAARAVNRVAIALTFLFGVDRVGTELGDQFNASADLLAVQKFVVGLLISFVLLRLLRRRIWSTEDGAPLGPRWQRLRFLLSALVAAIPLTGVLGYVVLSRLLATQLVLTAALYVAVVLVQKIVTESIAQALNESAPSGRHLRTGLALSEDGVEILEFWVSGTASLLIALLGLVVFMLLWGVSAKDMSDWLYSVFFGLKIGNMTLSMAEVLMAIALFAALLTGTRMLQRSLDQRIFPKTRLDTGVRHSIRSAVGYIGFTLAGMLAVSTVGIDLSNLAIIAGALSVGIGFGLQNIVNNFVSGLILLVERPIKVGDSVAVGEHQGYVKKISVRATEIATADRASVFIPNSVLISTSVVNRTYADKIGRVVLPLGLAYGADVERVRAVLLDIAGRHPEIRRNPAPSVQFKGFGENALNFQLSAFVHDVDKVASVTSDLCFTINAEVRPLGLQMPSAEKDVRVHLDDAQMALILGAGRRRTDPPEDSGTEEPPPG